MGECRFGESLEGPEHAFSILGACVGGTGRDHSGTGLAAQEMDRVVGHTGDHVSNIVARSIGHILGKQVLVVGISKEGLFNALVQDSPDKLERSFFFVG